jgi:hypothetical protein
VQDLSFLAAPVVIWNQQNDTVQIISVNFVTTQDLGGVSNINIVPLADVNQSTYEIYNSFNWLVLSGNLTYSNGQWSSAPMSMAWKGNGNFYAIVQMTDIANGTTLVSPQAPFTRANQTEEIIEIVGISVIVGVVVIAIIMIYVKKRGNKDLTRKEKKKDKEIKVHEVSKEEIKKAKAGKAPAPKKEAKPSEQKGVTKKSDEFIFEVPKWEDEDNSNE